MTVALATSLAKCAETKAGAVKAYDDARAELVRHNAGGKPR
jgi:hypothetical protein